MVEGYVPVGNQDKKLTPGLPAVKHPLTATEDNRLNLFQERYS
jgi:hypothetical protein